MTSCISVLSRGDHYFDQSILICLNGVQGADGQLLRACRILPSLQKSLVTAKQEAYQLNEFGLPHGVVAVRIGAKLLGRNEGMTSSSAYHIIPLDFTAKMKEGIAAI